MNHVVGTGSVVQFHTLGSLWLQILHPFIFLVCKTDCREVSDRDELGLEVRWGPELFCSYKNNPMSSSKHEFSFVHYDLKRIRSLRYWDIGELLREVVGYSQR